MIPGFSFPLKIILFLSMFSDCYYHDIVRTPVAGRVLIIILPIPIVNMILMYYVLIAYVHTEPFRAYVSTKLSVSLFFFTAIIIIVINNNDSDRKK
jgi:hypothetical protein